jgi:hypothetical protein
MPNKTQIKMILGCDINGSIPSGAKKRIRHVIFKMRSGELEA